MAMDQAWWDKSLTAFQREIGYRFQNERLIHEALTHASFAHEAGIPFWNERLEFLGDAVLGVVVTEHLYRAYPGEPEGWLAKMRAAVVNTYALADVARGLPRFFRQHRIFRRAALHRLSQRVDRPHRRLSPRRHPLSQACVRHATRHGQANVCARATTSSPPFDHASPQGPIPPRA